MLTESTRLICPYLEKIHLGIPHPAGQVTFIAGTIGEHTNNVPVAEQPHRINVEFSYTAEPLF